MPASSFRSVRIKFVTSSWHSRWSISTALCASVATEPFRKCLMDWFSGQLKISVRFTLSSIQHLILIFELSHFRSRCQRCRCARSNSKNWNANRCDTGWQHWYGRLLLEWHHRHSDECSEYCARPNQRVGFVQCEQSKWTCQILCKRYVLWFLGRCGHRKWEIPMDGTQTIRLFRFQKITTESWLRRRNNDATCTER